MRINASVGRSPKTESIRDGIHNLKFVAENKSEKQFLAALYEAVRNHLDYNGTVLRASPPEIQLRLKKLSKEELLKSGAAGRTMTTTKKHLEQTGQGWAEPPEDGA
jgi:hypothetical protein